MYYSYNLTFLTFVCKPLGRVCLWKGIVYFSINKIICFLLLLLYIIIYFLKLNLFLENQDNKRK